MLIHTQDSLDNGSTICLIHMVDSCNLCRQIHTLLEQHLSKEVRLAFGTGNGLEIFHINALYNTLEKNKSMAYLFTGCDTTSRKGKKSACNMWILIPDVPFAFLPILILQSSKHWNSSVLLYTTRNV